MKGFGRSASQLTFNVNSHDETNEASHDELITVEKYFAKKYRPLRYPHLPCIDARNGDRERAHWLPMEVVKVRLSGLNMVFV